MTCPFLAGKEILILIKRLSWQASSRVSMRSRSTSPKTSGPYFVPISEIKGGKRPLHNIPIPEKRRPKPKKRSNSVWDILGSLFPASCTSGEDFIPASPMHTTYRAPPPPTYRRCQLKPYSRPTSGRDTPQAVPTSPPRKKSASVTFSKSAHTTPAKRRFSFNRGSCASSLPSGDKWVPGQAKAFGELQQSGLLEEDKKVPDDQNEFPFCVFFGARVPLICLPTGAV